MALGRAGALSSAVTVTLSSAGIATLTPPYKTKTDLVAVLGFSTIIANDSAVAAIHHGSVPSPSTEPQHRLQHTNTQNIGNKRTTRNPRPGRKLVTSPTQHRGPALTERGQNTFETLPPHGTRAITHHNDYTLLYPYVEHNGYKVPADTNNT